MANFDKIETLFRSEYPRLLNMAFRIIPDEQTARDVVHNAFTSLFSGSTADITPAYLTAAVRNKCLSALRDMSVRDRMKQLYFLDTEEIESEEWPDEETLSLMRDAMQTDLTPQCRRVLDLRFFHNMSYQEIADTLSISKVSVYRHLRHAIDTLRTKLAPYG